MMRRRRDSRNSLWNAGTGPSGHVFGLSRLTPELKLWTGSQLYVFCAAVGRSDTAASFLRQFRGRRRMPANPPVSRVSAPRPRALR